MTTLDEAYQRACTEPSDIYQHVPTLKLLARQCRRVTEFGVRTGVSTWGLLAGRPALYVGYDIVDRDYTTHRLAGEEAGIPCEFVLGDTTKQVIGETDLLFIDTSHTEFQLEQELRQSAGDVTKFIALHDTETFGRSGEDGGRGLMYAVELFLENYPQWRLLVHYTNCNGFTVLERVSENPDGL